MGDHGAKAYGYINESPAIAFIAGISGWVVLDLFLYFAFRSGQFQTVNPVILYTLPFFMFAITSGAVGGTLFNYFTVPMSGRALSKKQYLEGALLGLIVGAGVIGLLYYTTPVFNSITGLSISPSLMIASVDPVPLMVMHFYGISSILSFLTSYIFILFLVVAVSEEVLVLITYKLFVQAFRGEGFGVWPAIIMSIVLAGIFWGLAHIPAYISELGSANVLGGVLIAILVGTIFFRLLSEAIWHDMNIAFMITSHAAYDIILGVVVLSISFTAISVI